jgi:coenzyme F420 hydrogenase subunit beta
MIMAAKEKYPEPTYLEYGFGELEHDVIKKELCCYCGNCIAFSPKIDREGNRPELVDYDPLCGLCYAYCPRTMLDMPGMAKRVFGRERREDEPLGIYRKAASARAVKAGARAQDGGVATALLIGALEAGIIDCAVVTDRDDKWRGIPKVATTAEEIAAAAGTKYTITPTVTGVQMAMDMGKKKIGFVGTPCQIQALRKVQLLEEPYAFGQEKIALLVGLFCMENFEHELLFPHLVEGKFGFKAEEVDKFEIQKGMFRVLSRRGAQEVPLEETDDYVWKGCGPCFDFAAELADVSVGSVGSRAGWSTVLTRTAAGAKVYESALAAGAIEAAAASEKGLALAGRLAKGKEERFSAKRAELLSRGVPVNIRR